MLSWMARRLGSSARWEVLTIVNASSWDGRLRVAAALRIPRCAKPAATDGESEPFLRYVDSQQNEIQAFPKTQSYRLLTFASQILYEISMQAKYHVFAFACV